MKTKNQQVLLYDDNCPLCAAYTKAFIKSGMLSKENRVAFSTINILEYPLNSKRARHEIPLVNLKTGEVKYGIDALAEILNRKIFFVKPVLRIAWIYWLFKKLYSFISYNRKIIVASPSCLKTCFDCSPDYSFKHRYALLLFTWVLSSFIQVQITYSYFLSVDSRWILLWPIIPILLAINKSKHAATDILVHSGITMLLSTIFFLFALQFFSMLFTFSWLVIAISLAITTTILAHQIWRRIQHHCHEHFS